MYSFKHSFFVFISFYFVTISVFSFPQKNNTKFDSINKQCQYSLEIPFLNSPNQVVSHTGYSLSYNEKHEQADWVAYSLNLNKLNAVVKRKDRFKADPFVITGSAEVSDYTRSGFDKGHLAPSADMCYSEITMLESFYMSNMSPQNPGFNRGIWKNLEEEVRNWGEKFKEIFIVTGPVLLESLKTIGKNKVSIPDFYYKVILDTVSKTKKGIGFIMPNKSLKYPISNFCVPIDSVEKVTGIDFFPNLPDSLENLIESKSDFSEWSIPKTVKIDKKKNKSKAIKKYRK